MENKNIPSLESLLTEKESGISYNIDKITDNIYLGKVDGLKDKDYFKAEKITCSLTFNL